VSDLLYIHPAYADLLRANGLHRFEDFMRAKGLFCKTPGRHDQSLTLTLEDPGGSRKFLLKRTTHTGLKQVLGHLLAFRRPLAAPVREFGAIKLCRDGGLDTMQPAACGQHSRFMIPYSGFLLLEQLPSGCHLQRLMQSWSTGSRPPAHHVHRLFYELGRLIGRLHHARLVCPALSPRQIVVQPDQRQDRDSWWQFFLTDLTDVTTGSARRIQNRDLRQLLRRCGRLRPTKNDLLRFALGYVSTRYPAAASRTIAMRRSFGWAKRLLSSIARSPAPAEQERFVRMGRVIVNTSYMYLLQENALGSFSAVFRYHGGTTLNKPGLTWRQRIKVDLTRDDAPPITIFLKRYDRPPWPVQLRRLLLRRADHSTAWWEWQQLRRLRRAGIPTPTPVAFAEKMSRWLEKRSFIALAAAPGESLERWVPQNMLRHAPTLSFARRRNLVQQLAVLVRSLHQAGFRHRDLYLSHVFVDFDRTPQPCLTLIDLQRVFRPRWRRRRWLIKDLAALHYSSPARAIHATDRLRFLLTYLDRHRLTIPDKRLARGILAKTRRIARHNRPRS